VLKHLLYNSAIFTFTLCFLLFSSCSGYSETPQGIDIQEAYRNAIEDARTAESSEISRNLVAITGYNDELIWEGEPGESSVLVVTWTSWDGYHSKAGESITCTRDIWVTAVPDVRDFCVESSLSGDELTLRLEQLLGLPPNSGKGWFVEIWADVDDLFRPSPDPDITDHEAELDFPKNVNEEHILWFNELKDKSYGENGYPWTRLGYTYDWGNPEREIGLSEFTLTSGAVIEVHSVSNTSDYCE